MPAATAGATGMLGGFGPDAGAYGGVPVFGPTTATMVPNMGGWFSGPTYMDLTSLAGIYSTGAFIAPLINTTTTAGQAAANQSGTIADGIASFDQVRSLQLGPSRYVHTAPLHTAAGATVGTYDFVFDINFANKQAGGGGSKISGHSTMIDGDNAFDFALPQKPYEGAVGGAQFHFAAGELTDSIGDSSHQASAVVDVSLRNAGGTIAAFAHHEVTITGDPDIASNVVFGNGDTGTRTAQ